MSGPVKITDFPSASVLGGTEVVAGVQGTSGTYGGTVKVLISQIGTYVRGLFTTTPATIAEGGTNAATATAARASLGSTTVGDAVFIASSALVAKTALGVGEFVPVTSISGTNTITGVIPTANSAYVTNGLYVLIPANTNTSATTANFTPSGASALGAKNIFCGGVALTGKELVAGVPVLLVYDGTQFNIGSDITVNGTTATTFTYNGSGGTSASVTITWKRDGNWVRLNIPPVSATSGTGSTTLSSNTALPAAIRPTANQSQPCNNVINNSAGTVDAGLLTITTAGIIGLVRDNVNTVWTNTAPGGFGSNGTSIEYFLG